MERRKGVLSEGEQGHGSMCAGSMCSNSIEFIWSALCRTRLYATGVHSQLDQFALCPRPAPCWTLLSASFLPLLDVVANTTRGQLGLTEHTAIISCINLDADWACEHFRKRNQTSHLANLQVCWDFLFVYKKDQSYLPSRPIVHPEQLQRDGISQALTINCISSPSTS